MKHEGFPPHLRLKRRRDFLAVQNSGSKHQLRFFLVFVRPYDQTRLGVTVTRKVGNAVIRNRVKRLVREVFRLRRFEFHGDVEMVWVAKRQAARASFRDVDSDMDRLLRRVSR